MPWSPRVWSAGPNGSVEVRTSTRSRLGEGRDGLITSAPAPPPILPLPLAHASPVRLCRLYGHLYVIRRCYRATTTMTAQREEFDGSSTIRRGCGGRRFSGIRDHGAGPCGDRAAVVA